MDLALSIYKKLFINKIINHNELNPQIFKLLIKFSLLLFYKLYFFLAKTCQTNLLRPA